MVNYLTFKGWKADLKETLTDFSDPGILIKRQFIHSDSKYGDLTSKEIEDIVFEACALWFLSEKEFKLYQATHKWPLGPCLIYDGKKKRRFDDTKLFEGVKYGL